MARLKRIYWKNKIRWLAMFLVAVIAFSLFMFVTQNPKKALAAVSRTGSVVNIQNSADSGSQSVTVPSDAMLAVVTIEGYSATTTKISGFTSLTLGGVGMTLQQSNVDTASDGDQCGIFTLVNPTAGSQTLAWDWGGTGAWIDGGQINVAFYNGLNISSPVGSKGGGTANPSGLAASANTPASAGTLAATSADAIVGVAYFSPNNAPAFSWTGLTAINKLGFNNSGGAYGETFPSGNTAVSGSMSVSSNFVTMSAIVIKAGVSNSTPSAPALSLPTAGASGVSLLPQFQLRSSDANNDYLRYKLQLCQDAACSTVLQTFDQTSSQTGWSGQNQQTGTAYTGSSSIGSSTIATYTAQSPLNPNTTYYWRGFAIDPGGSNTFSAASSIQSFTTKTFPTPGILDNFNRANANPLSGSWAGIGIYASQALQITSNQAAGTVSGRSGEYYTAAAYGPDTQVYATVSTRPVNDNEAIDLWLRGTNLSNSATSTGYFLRWQFESAAADNWSIIRRDAGTSVTLATFAGSDLAAGNKIGFEASGTYLYAYRFDGTSWTTVMAYNTAADTTKYNSAGNIGFAIEDTQARVDDFGGGSASSSGVLIQGGTVIQGGTIIQ